MSNHLYTKEDVKEALGITDLRNLSVEKVAELVSLLPQMDKDLALAIIGEFSNYSDMCKTMVQEMGSLCDTAIKESKDSQKDTISAYKQVLNALEESLNDDSLSYEEKMKITDKMIEVADKISAKDTEQKAFYKDLIRDNGRLIAGAIVLGASILGVSIKGSPKGKLPKIKQ